MPRNSLLNGKAAPDTGGTQLDEAAYPILMAYLAGLGGDAALWTRTTSSRPLTSSSPTARPTAWSGGRSRPATRPSTIAAEIAGLTAAVRHRGSSHGDAAAAPACTRPPPTTSSATSRPGR